MRNYRFIIRSKGIIRCYDRSKRINKVEAKTEDFSVFCGRYGFLCRKLRLFVLTGLPREISIKASASLRSEGVCGTRLPQTGVSRNTEKLWLLRRRPEGEPSRYDGDGKRAPTGTRGAIGRKRHKKRRTRGTSHGGVLGIPNPHLIRKPVSRGVNTSAVSDPASLRLLVIYNNEQ